MSVPPIDDSVNPCGGGEDVGILTPIELPVTSQDHCDELNAKSQDPDFAARMAELKAKAGTQNFESAYAIYQNAVTGLGFSNLVNGSSSQAQVKLNPNQSQTLSQTNCIGFMHCHLDDDPTTGKPRTYKIFTFTDIVALAKTDNVSTNPMQEMVLYVTTASGTFALKINNSTSFKNKFANLNQAQEMLNDAIFKRFVKEGDTVDKAKI
jgi:hypothetical protein